MKNIKFNNKIAQNIRTHIENMNSNKTHRKKFQNCENNIQCNNKRCNIDYKQKRKIENSNNTVKTDQKDMLFHKNKATHIDNKQIHYLTKTIAAHIEKYKTLSFEQNTHSNAH